MSRAPKILLEAEFNPKVRTYWLLGGTLLLLVTLIGIPLLLVWLPAGRYLTGRYLARMRCTLTERHLLVSKGILVHTEKTIPLGKITDLGMVQGPIMRAFGIHALSVETAGQSGGGALVTLTGIQDAAAFREAVLTQRDRLEQVYGQADDTPSTELPAAGDEQLALLREIAASLRRIEQQGLTMHQDDTSPDA